MENLTTKEEKDLRLKLKGDEIEIMQDYALGLHTETLIKADGEKLANIFLQHKYITPKTYFLIRHGIDALNALVNAVILPPK